MGGEGGEGRGRKREGKKSSCSGCKWKHIDKLQTGSTLCTFKKLSSVPVLGKNLLKSGSFAFSPSTLSRRTHHDSDKCTSLFYSKCQAS